MRKIINFLMLLGVSCCILPCFFLSVSATDKIGVCLNGRNINFEVEPMLHNERVMVPMREICKNLGVGLEWNETTQSITIEKSYAEGKSHIIKMKIGDCSIVKDDFEFIIEVPPMLKDGRTFLPLRGLSDVLGIDVDWDGKNNTAVLTSDGVYTLSGYMAIPDPERCMQSIYFGHSFNEDSSAEYIFYEYDNENEAEEACNTYAQLLERRNFKPVISFETLYFCNLDFPDYVVKILNTEDEGQHYMGVIVEKSKFYFWPNGEAILCPVSLKQELLNLGYSENYYYQEKELWVNKKILKDFSKDIDVSLLDTWTPIKVSGYDESNVSKKNEFTIRVNTVYFQLNDKIYKTSNYNIKNGSKGFIYDQNPKEKFNLTDSDWSYVQGGVTYPGMYSYVFELIEGKPDSRNHYGVLTQYVYGDSYYYFKNGEYVGR